MWSLWPIFHGPVILPYILKTIWHMKTILWDYKSVWRDVQPENKCRSVWPIFHGPVILPYILKTICSMNIILWDYESVLHNIWPQNKCRSLWPIFMVQWFCLISWKLFTSWTSLGLWVSMTRHLTSKYLSVTVIWNKKIILLELVLFHFPNVLDCFRFYFYF